MNRTHNVILKLIQNERRKRKAYSKVKNLSVEFSLDSIKQMRQVLEGKRRTMSYGQYMTTTKVIDDFEKEVKPIYY